MTIRQEILKLERDTKRRDALVRKVVSTLNGAEDDLVREMRGQFGWIARAGYDSSGRTLNGVEKGLLQVDDLLRQAYRGVETDLRSGLLRLGKDEIGHQQQILAVNGRDLLKPDGKFMSNLLANVPFRGGRLRDWMIRLTDNAMQRIEGAIRGRLAAKLPIEDVIRAVIGTRALQYADGATEPGRNELAKLTNQATAFTTRKAREEVWSVNKAVVEAVEWVAVGDGAKCPLEPDTCEDRDGMLYTADTHEPIGHDMPWLEGPGLAHWGCRCVAIPVLRADEEAA